MPSKVGQQTVLEYCDIQEESSVGNNCIISNVVIPAGACIPDNAFMTTVCVEVGDVAGLYVTIVFGVKDNVKKMTRSEDLGKLQYFGWPLDKALSLLDMKQDSDLEIVSLWQVKLFPVFESCRESTCYALNMLNALTNGSKIKEGNSGAVQRYLSMKDVLDFKDIEGTLKIRENLRKKILGS